MVRRPSVSVVIPTYNSEATIVRAIDSVMNQTYSPHEILVVDDASFDSTSAIVRGYETNGVKLISLLKHSGAGAARNNGIEAAKGDLIAFLDSDDEWLPTKLQEQIAVLVADTRASFVSCASNLISASGQDLGDLYKGHEVVAGAECWRALLAFNFVATPTVVAWRDRLIELGGFDEGLKIGEDQDLWIKLAIAGELAYVPRSLVRVHARENSLSAWSLQDSLTYTLPMVERHLAQLDSRLSDKEVRKIMGERLGRLGRAAYARGAIRAGLWLIGRSALRGYRPLEGIYWLASASPPAMWLRRQLKIVTLP